MGLTGKTNPPPKRSSVDDRSGGHSPWLERFARTEFFSILRTWLLERSSTGR